MSERTIALVRDDVVVNIVVVDDNTPDDFFDLLQQAEPHDRTVDPDELAHPIAIGHIYKAGRGYVPPIEVAVEANRVVITDNRLEPATELTATTVTGDPDTGQPITDDTGQPTDRAEHTVPVANGRAVVNVPEATPDAPILVEVPELGIRVDVRGPTPAKAAR